MERTFVKGPRQSPLQVSETLLVAVENLGFSQLRLFCEVKNFGYPSTIYLDSQIFGDPGRTKTSRPIKVSAARDSKVDQVGRPEDNRSVSCTETPYTTLGSHPN